MKIPLSKGLFTEIDDADWPLVAGYPWRALKSGRQGYRAAARQKLRLVYLHRLIMGAEKGEDVDHIDGNPLNNRRCNLRRCTHRQNLSAHRHKASTHTSASRFRGVGWAGNPRNIWRARLKIRGLKDFHLGYFENEIDAARAYDAAALKYFGEFACPNFKQPGA